MRQRAFRRAAATAGVALVLVSAALAADTGGGTIIYTYQGLTWTMNSDGSGKASLPSGVGGTPSRSLHGGHRWFLQTRDIEGETYPNGKPRREVFAVRDDGNASFTKQLTDQPALECHAVSLSSNLGWKPGDGHISMVARRWSGGAVVEGGVYEAEILFDGNGDVTGLAAQPGTPAIAVSLVVWSQHYFAGELAPDVFEMDWAPDGAQIAYARVSTMELRIANTSGGGQALVSGTVARAPAWSPDGTKIAFGSATGISTIKPDGTGLKQIILHQLIKKGMYTVGFTRWSPTGSHVAYLRSATSGIPREQDVYRAAADGTQQTNLTGGISGSAAPVSWR